MKKILLSILFLSGLSASAQLTVFEDSFETYEDFLTTGFGDWQTLDLDLLNTYTGGQATGATPWLNAGTPQAYQIFNPTTAVVTNATINVGGSTESRNFDPRTGSKYAACWAGVPSTTGGATANSDFLISPVLNLGTSNNELRFWSKSMSDSYGLEKYRVYVYVGTGTPTLLSQFTLVSGIAVLTAPYGSWLENVIALNAYSNQSIRIGIRCITADAYMFMVDDFKVTSSNLKTNEFFSNKFSAYPNPTNNVVNITNSDNILLSEVSITDMNGRIVKTVNTNNLTEVQINVADLTTGVYFMNINTDSGKAVKKFIKN